MRSRKEIEARIAEIEADPRYHYDVRYETNIYLFTMQAEWNAEIHALKWVLKGDDYDTE